MEITPPERSPLPFAAALFSGTGFTQTWLVYNGTDERWAESRELSSPRCLVQTPVPWDTDPKALAAFIARHTDAMTYLAMRMYSWAGGWLFPRLCEALHALGRVVHDVVLADAVRRSRLLPAWLPANPLSMTRLGTIQVPANVRQVWWVRQRQNRPQGHDVVPADPAMTVVDPPVWAGCRHADIDDSPEYQRLCAAQNERIAAAVRGRIAA